MSFTNRSPATDDVSQFVAARIKEQIPNVLRHLLQHEDGSNSDSLRLECALVASNHTDDRSTRRLQFATIDLDSALLRSSLSKYRSLGENIVSEQPDDQSQESTSSPHDELKLDQRTRALDRDERDDDESLPSKRRKATGSLRLTRTGIGSDTTDDLATNISRRLETSSKIFPQRRKKVSDNPAMQPSTLGKLIAGIWENIYSGVKLDPQDIIGQWQAIQSSGQPRLLAETEAEVAERHSASVQGVYGRMNVLCRKISQTSRCCRSLEVIVQAKWVQCFDERIAELTASMPREKSKKTAIAEACCDFSWSEKELRNKMAIWRGYFNIKNAGGWPALVFAGMGLYRFCKYRMSFTDETFSKLRALRPRLEVAADTIHPRWRQLLGIIGDSTDRKYIGHPHDWVVAGPEPVPLRTTYLQWDKDFSYHHLDHSSLDEDAWGLFDPRATHSASVSSVYKCDTCDEVQSEDSMSNNCNCFPHLYGSSKYAASPVQVFRTSNGKNNGLLACLPFERGSAIGEFVGQITSGLENKDVMVGQTEKASYQIWQGRQGNHTRFVNHSCQPNSQYERFVWLGAQRIVLVSKGIDAGEEITVDYSDTYWKNLDKHCLCGQPKCRYRGRTQLITPPDSI